METLLGIIITVAVAGLFLAYTSDVTVDVSDDFAVDHCGSRTDGYTSYNSSARVCYNASSATVPVASIAWNVTQDSFKADQEVSSKIPTATKILMVTIILMALGALAAFFRRG